MRLILASLMLCTAFSSHAVSDQKLIKACLEKGTEKLNEEAFSKHSMLDPVTVKVCGLDNRTFNISSYVWYCGKDYDGKKLGPVMTQKPKLSDCL